MMKLMKYTTLMLFAMLVTSAYAESDGELSLSVKGTTVKGDDGQYREANYATDETGGVGIESLRLNSVDGDSSFEVYLRAIPLTEYRWKLQYTKEDSFYLLLDGSVDRRYYDGSNEAWDPSAYGLTGNEFIPDNRTSPAGVIDDGFHSTADFANRPDEDIYADRGDITLEFGLINPDMPEITLGWNRWFRHGQELLLRSERARVTNPTDSKNGEFFPRSRSIPALTSLDGVSDTVYLEVGKKVGDASSVTFRQEYESYRDSQVSEFPRYLWDQSKPSAEIEQYRTFEDEPEFESLTSILMFDSQLSEDTYLAGGYLYNNLENTSSREVVRPNRGSASQIYHSVDTKTKNTRDSHVVTLGVRRDKILPDVALIAGLRVENAETESGTSLRSGASSMTSGGKIRESASELDELRLEGNVEFQFRGIENTVVSIEAEVEQRELDWSEYEDMQSHETFQDNHFGSEVPFFDYATDTTHLDQEYSLKIVNRSLQNWRLKGGYTRKLLDRDYDIKRDNDPRFYPGSLQGYKIEGDEASVAVNRYMMNGCTLNLMYQYIQEDISTDFAQGNSQEWLINRVSASLSGAPFMNVFVSSTLIYEDYELNTPVNITDSKSNWAPGTEAYDYDGDYVTALLNAVCTLSETTQIDVDYQYTGSLGDYNEYVLNKLTTGVTFETDNGDTVGLAYELVDFADKAGSGFDDYTANSVSARYAHSF